MRPVMLAWELGENLGHAMPLSRIAALLRSEGVSVFVCARSLDAARIAFRGMEATILQAPTWPAFRHLGVPTGSGNYVDILTSIGFHVVERLAAVVAGWVATIDLVKPAVVVADHSPALLVAARIRNLPVVQVGTPYLMPPLEGARLPAVDALVSPVADEAKLLQSAAAVLRSWEKPAPDSLPGLLATTFRFVFGIPEIDPYATSRREPLYLPLEGLPQHRPVPAETSLFVYHGGGDPQAEALFLAIADVGAPVSCYLRGDAGMLPRFLEKRGVRVFAEPPPLSEVLPTASHVLSAAGAHLTQAAMAAGRPHLMMPRHDEAAANTRAATRLNVGRWIDPHWDRERLCREIEEALSNHSMMVETSRLARAISQRPARSAAELLKAAVMRSLR